MQAYHGLIGESQVTSGALPVQLRDEQVRTDHAPAANSVNSSTADCQLPPF
jgi:hypothetical protein